MSAAPSAEWNRSQLAAFARADQSRRWRQGCPLPVEEYLRQYPALAADERCLVDLIFTEALEREARGERIDVAEYVRRFPAHAELIRSQLAVHEFLRANPPESQVQTLTLMSPTILPAASVIAPAANGFSVPGYEILGKLGQGGMGVVYQARHLKLNRVVALKMVLHGEHANEEYLTRFLAEAEAVAQLHHPNVVQLFDAGQHGGLPFFTLEFVPGGSLADKLREQPLNAAEAARTVAAVARGVQHAHERGIIHRDLKPANVLLAEDGTPKVTDFGLARRVEAAGLTATGAVMGTPSYMAPEQASGETKLIGPAADVYALGAILYECLTGRPPFRAATAMDTMLQVLNEEPAAVRSLQPNVPRDLDTICHKCLQKEASRRYGSAAELTKDLERFLRGEPVRARPVGVTSRMARWVRRRPGVAVLLFLLALTWLGGTASMVWLWRRSSHQAEVASDALRGLQESERSREWWLKAVAKLDERERRSFGAFVRFVQSRPDVAKMPPLAAIEAFNKEHPDSQLPTAVFSREAQMAQGGEAGTASAGSFNPTMFGD